MLHSCNILNLEIFLFKSYNDFGSKLVIVFMDKVLLPMDIPRPV